MRSLEKGRRRRRPRAHAVFASGAAFVGLACSGVPVEPVAVEASGPPPFALQFAGRYVADDPEPGALRAVELRRDGTYVATLAGKGATLRGAYLAESTLALPLVLEGDGWVVRIDAYDGRARADIGGRTSMLQATGAVGPDEALCSATGGRWLDDDADPRTGLYCRCQATDDYIPALGGCVTRVPADGA